MCLAAELELYSSVFFNFFILYFFSFSFSSRSTCECLSPWNEAYGLSSIKSQRGWSLPNERTNGWAGEWTHSLAQPGCQKTNQHLIRGHPALPHTLLLLFLSVFLPSLSPSFSAPHITAGFALTVFLVAICVQFNHTLEVKSLHFNFGTGDVKDGHLTIWQLLFSIPAHTHKHTHSTHTQCTWLELWTAHEPNSANCLRSVPWNYNCVIFFREGRMFCAVQGPMVLLFSRPLGKLPFSGPIRGADAS